MQNDHPFNTEIKFTDIQFVRSFVLACLAYQIVVWFDKIEMIFSLDENKLQPLCCMRYKHESNIAVF